MKHLLRKWFNTETECWCIELYDDVENEIFRHEGVTDAGVKVFVKA